MATTTNNYQIEISLQHEGEPTPFMVGDALKRALDTLPGENFGYSFDPFWEGEGAENRTIDLPLTFDGEHIGMAYITKEA